MHLDNWLLNLSRICRRVKSQARFGSEDEDGTTIMFDADSDDQAHQFPFGCWICRPEKYCIQRILSQETLKLPLHVSGRSCDKSRPFSFPHKCDNSCYFPISQTCCTISHCHSWWNCLPIHFRIEKEHPFHYSILCSTVLWTPEDLHSCVQSSPHLWAVCSSSHQLTLTLCT